VGALGGSLEAIQDWMTVSILLGGSRTIKQTGALHRPMQAIQQDAQQIDHFSGLPRFDWSLSAWLGVGVLL
jgi:hypothetical protein